ncbi:MAG: 23S rRNA (guanosine(2251)-2'-O)-methyltransferase RlmB [Candidatus Hydrogenedentes bacterium]|nr:23S rRNA (guanosine(2251)-2'-O)-methyltransferase RlmB [Candidatus Hydrogenedentota bacterium]
MAGTIIHGINAVSEALLQGGVVNRLYLARESRAHGYQKVVDLAREHQVPFDFVPQAKLNELTGTQEHQGVAASISPMQYTALEDCLAACPPKAILLALDQVQHPKNIGMIIRTAAGAGVSGVLLPARGGMLLDESLIRASAGVLLRMPIVLAPNLSRDLEILKKDGWWIFALDAHGAQPLYTTTWPDRVVLVVGNETKGLRPGVRKVCDTVVAIPLANALDSLNVSVAAGIALFHIAEQHAR